MGVPRGFIRILNQELGNGKTRTVESLQLDHNPLAGIVPVDMPL
jgi:hypothetical protein